MTFARRSVFPVKQRDMPPPDVAPRLERPCSFDGGVHPIGSRIVAKVERRIFENQDAYVNLERFRDWLKTGAGWGTYQLVNGVMRFVPTSLSFEAASDDEMREFTEHAVEFLRTARAQKKLWRHLKPAQRTEMMETLLAEPVKEQHQ